MQRFIRPGLQAVEVLLEEFDVAPYCSGNEPGLADICLIPQLYNARRWEVQIDDLPRILAIEETCASHPAFDAADPDRVRPS